MSEESSKVRWLGTVSLAFYAVHAGQYLVRRQGEHLLWVCHLAALAVGFGLLLRLPSLNGAGTLWLSVGLPLWIWDLVSGGDFVPTSLLTHVGSLIVGLLGVRMLGLPSNTWWKAGLGLIPIYGVSRFCTSPAANVNLSHQAYPGIERWIPWYPLYVAGLLGLFTAGGLLVQILLRRGRTA